MVNNIVVHIGAHKTASTLLANALRADRKRLRKTDVSILFRGAMKEMEFFKELNRIKRGRVKNGETLPSDSAKQEIEMLLKEKVGVLVLTNEDLMSELDFDKFFPQPEASAKYMVDVFGGRKLKLVLYVRNQIEYIESIYIQKVQVGKAGTFDEFISKGLPTNLDWYSIIKCIQKLSDDVEIVVVPYESIHSGVDRFYQNFLTIAGVPEPESFAVDKSSSGGRRANRSFSSKAIEIFNLVSPVLDEKELSEMRVFLQDKFSIEHYPRPRLLNNEQKKQVSNMYKDSNKRLFDEFLEEHKDVSGYYFFGD